MWQYPMHEFHNRAHSYQIQKLMTVDKLILPYKKEVPGQISSG